MTVEEIKKFAKEYVQNNTDKSVNSFIGEQLQKAFIEGTDFMYYSNNEELRRQLTEKGKQIAELKAQIEKLETYNEKLLDSDIEKHNKIVELKEKLEIEQNARGDWFGKAVTKDRQLTEAKDLIRNLLRVTYGEGWNYSLDVKVKAEEFLREEKV